MKKFIFPYWLILMCFLYSPFNSFSQNPGSECRLYLNFPYYSFEITGGFIQVYKISSHYNLLSQQCNSFLGYIITNPLLRNYLLQQEKNNCNFYFNSFFNRCRCDTTSFLYIYKTPEVSDVSEKKVIFDKKIFEASLLEIRDSAIKALNKAYPEYIIKITLLYKNEINNCL